MLEYSRKENTIFSSVTKNALNGIALAMGIAVIAASVLQTLDIDAGVSMPGMGSAALALASFR
jgi:hypothetical protein